MSNVRGQENRACLEILSKISDRICSNATAEKLNSSARAAACSWSPAFPTSWTSHVPGVWPEVEGEKAVRRCSSGPPPSSALSIVARQ